MSDAEFRTFLRDVCEAASIDSEAKTIGLIRAVLRTLSECLPGLLANELASDLPAPLASSLRREDWMEGKPLSSVEFAGRVALREHSTPLVAQAHIAIVNSALAKVLPADMWRRLLAELPAQYGAVLYASPIPSAAAPLLKAQ